MHRTPSGLLPLLALTLLACGGGGDAGPPPVSTTLLPIPALTGEIEFPLGVATDHSLRVGDYETNVPVRGFCAIDLTDLPAGARVESALLRLRLSGTNGEPWDDGGDLLVDHLDPGAVLDPADYDGPALHAAFAVVPRFEVGATYDLQVGPQVQSDLDAGRSASGFRFRFELAPNGDGFHDFLVFAGSNSSIGPHPFLVVTWRP